MPASSGPYGNHQPSRRRMLQTAFQPISLVRSSSLFIFIGSESINFYPRLTMATETSQYGVEIRDNTVLSLSRIRGYHGPVLICSYLDSSRQHTNIFTFPYKCYCSSQLCGRMFNYTRHATFVLSELRSVDRAILATRSGGTRAEICCIRSPPILVLATRSLAICRELCQAMDNHLTLLFHSLPPDQLQSVQSSPRLNTITSHRCDPLLDTGSVAIYVEL